MSLDLTLRITEIMLSLAIAQQSLEHLSDVKDRWIFAPRLILCLLLLAGVGGAWPLWGLWLISVVMLHRFDGAYNGGSDKMTFLILTCVALAQVAPDLFWQEMALSYLAVQLVLSYFVSGYVKIMNPTWRRGQALCDVFAYSAYPVSQRLGGWAEYPRTMWAMSWGVIGFEVLFPLTLFHPGALIPMLCVTSAFHLANACLFGLNRFFWIWLCAYPSILWFQARIFSTAG